MDEANMYGAYRVEMYLVDPDTGHRQRVKRPLTRLKLRDDRDWTYRTPDYSRWHKALRKLDKRSSRRHI